MKNKEMDAMKFILTSSLRYKLTREELMVLIAVAVLPTPKSFMELSFFFLKDFFYLFLTVF